ncbi:hypothetical protein M0804_004860 [Polistes exclamans]|nr:hypothetical protein M0804_004860 [Polistes exclamans]
MKNKIKKICQSDDGYGGDGVVGGGNDGNGFARALIPSSPPQPPPSSSPLPSPSPQPCISLYMRPGMERDSFLVKVLKGC